MNRPRDRVVTKDTHWNAAAPWNRLGLYLPLKAILEIQNEAPRRVEDFSRRPA